MRFCLTLLVLLTICPATLRAQEPASATTPPSADPPVSGQVDQNADPKVLLQRIKQEFEEEFSQLPQLGERSFQDVVKIELQDGQMVVSTKLPPTDVKARVKVLGADGFTTIMVQATPGESGPEGVNLLVLDMTHHDFPDAAATTIRHTTIFATPQHMQVVCDVESTERDTTIQLIQSRQPGEIEGEMTMKTSLYVHALQNDEKVVDLKMHAGSIGELRSTYPRETTQYLLPIFELLQQESAIFGADVKQAWQVLAPRLTPDEKTKVRVAAIVEKLNADSYQEREDASRELEKLGESAAVVLVRSSRANLSLEQINRIDAFLATYQPLTPQSAAELAKKPEFLLDCLYIDNADIRKEAHAALSELTGRKIEFNNEATAAERSKAISKLRAEILADAK